MVTYSTTRLNLYIVIIYDFLLRFFARCALSFLSRFRSVFLTTGSGLGLGVRLPFFFVPFFEDRRNAAVSWAFSEDSFAL